MISVQSSSYPVETDPVDHNSVNSWESDQTLTPSEEDLKFNRKFANYQNKLPRGRRDSSGLAETCSSLCENCSSAASEGLHGYKGSDDGREEEDDDARTFVDVAQKSSANVSIELEAKSESAKPNHNNESQVINLEKVRSYKDTRLFSINRSLSVTSIDDDSLDPCNQLLKLPEINIDGHEPQKMEGYAAWGQLDTLLPAACNSENLDNAHQHYFSCTDHGNDDLMIFPPQFFARINASFHSSDDDNTSTLSKMFPENMIDDMVEGLLGKIYDEFFFNHAHTRYFENYAELAQMNHPIVCKEQITDVKLSSNLMLECYPIDKECATEEPVTPASPTVVEPTIQSVKVYQYDSDTDEENHDPVAQDEKIEEAIIEKVPEEKPMQIIKQDIEIEESQLALTTATADTSSVFCANTEVLFCKRHQEYIGFTEIINNFNDVCCIIEEDNSKMMRDADDSQSVRSLRRIDNNAKIQDSLELLEGCEEDLTTFIDLTVHMMNMNDFIGLDCSYADNQMYAVNYTNHVALNLCMAVSDNFSKVKYFMSKNSDMRTQIMSGFFLVDGNIINANNEDMKFHIMKLKPNSKIVLVRQLASDEQLNLQNFLRITY